MDYICPAIGGICFIWWIISLFQGDDEGGGYHEYAGSLGEFRGRVFESTHTLEDGETIDVIQFEVRGILLHRYDNEELTVGVNLCDITEQGNFGPVFSTMDWQQEDSTALLYHISELGPVELDVGFTDWVSVGFAPMDTTRFPRRGRRKLVACFYLYSTSSNPLMKYGVPENKECIYDYYESEFYFQVKKEGFVDRRENMNKTRRLAIHLAMCMSAADGYIDQSELDTINNWVEKISFMEDEEDRQGFIDEFSSLINEAYQQAISGTLSLGDTIQSINQCAEDEDKFEAVELILDVMTADGKADQSEMSMLDSVTANLQLDPSQVRALRDKRISSADSVQLDKADLRSLVGIADNMSPEEIKKHLNTEFRKWNSRATSGDAAGRKRASEMLDNIAEARRQYLS